MGADIIKYMCVYLLLLDAICAMYGCVINIIIIAYIELHLCIFILEEEKEILVTIHD